MVFINSMMLSNPLILPTKSINHNGSDLNLGTGSFTLDAEELCLSWWMKTGTTGASQVVHRKTNTFEVIINNAGATATLTFRVYESGPSVSATATTSTTFNSTNWNHIFCKVSTGASPVIEIWINGSEASYSTQTTSTSDIDISASDVEMGVLGGVVSLFTYQWGLFTTSKVIGDVYDSGPVVIEQSSGLESLLQTDNGTNPLFDTVKEVNWSESGSSAVSTDIPT